MFNLDKISDDKTHKTSILKNPTEGYIKCKKENIDSIPLGSFVKYTRSDGKDIKGGFLHKIWDNNGVKMLFFTHPPNSRWSVKLDNIVEILYKLTGKDVEFEQKDLKTQDTDTDTDTKISIKSLEIRINELEIELNEQKRKFIELLDIVSYLHKTIKE